MYRTIPYLGLPNDATGWTRLGDMVQAGTVSRDDAITILAWNDRNGCYRDGDCVGEGMDPLTHDEAMALLLETCREI